MKQLFMISLLLLFGGVAYGQEINIRNIVEKQTSSNDLPAYDTTAMYFSYAALLKNPNYYNGQRIMFLPTKFKGERPYDYICGFNLRDSVPMPEYADTVWIKKRKNLKPGDFRIDIPQTNVYKPQYVVNKKVKRFGYDVYASQGYIGFNIKDLTGFATPFENIEGQVFSVSSCSMTRDQAGTYRITFLLKDSEGTDVEFSFSNYYGADELGGRDSKIFPVLLMAYYEKNTNEYVGSSFVLRPQDGYIVNTYVAKKIDGGRYKVIDGELSCTESCFMEGKSESYSLSAKYDYCQYLTPFLIFQDKDKEELFANIETATGYLASIDGEQVEGNFSSIRSFKPLQLDNLVDTGTYYGALRAKEARLLAEKQAAEQVIADRVSAIRKKYGKTMADIILAGKVKIGMTKEMCREAWGVPDDINRTSGSWGVHEQWVYGYESYLYFENGVLTSVQN